MKNQNRALRWTITAFALAFSFRANVAAADAGFDAAQGTEWTLENGLKVAFFEVKSSSTVSIQLWYRVGSKDDPPHRRGSANVLEHLMFGGSKAMLPGMHRVFIESVGGQATSLTTEDATAFINTVPSAYLSETLQLEAERMRSLLFVKDSLKAAKETVLGKIKSRAKDPIALALDGFLKAAYAKHPYRNSVNGDKDEIARLKSEDLKSFYDTYYQPNNALLVVTGGVSASLLREEVKKYFGGIGAGGKVPRVQVEDSPSNAKPIQLPPGEVGLVFLGYRIPAAAADDIYALQLLSALVGIGSHGRLQRKLVATRMAVRVASEASLREGPGVLVFYSAYIHPELSQSVERTMIQVVEGVRQRPPTDAEMQAAKKQIFASFVYSLQSHTSFARQAGMSWILSTQAQLFLKDIARIEALTAADIQKVAEKYIGPDKRITVKIPHQGIPQGR